MVVLELLAVWIGILTWRKATAGRMRTLADRLLTPVADQDRELRRDDVHDLVYE
jgi:hypothetical protein